MVRTTSSHHQGPLIASLLNGTVLRCVALTFALAAILTGCKDYEPENNAAGEYLSWVAHNAGLSGSSAVNNDDDYTLVVLQTDSQQGCQNLYSDTIKSFGYMVVFQSLSSKELVAPGGTEQLRENPILMAADITPEKWQRYCADMKTTRERHLGCTLPDDMKFNIGIWTRAFFDQGEFEEVAVKAEHFVVSESMTLSASKPLPPDVECAMAQ